MKEPVEGWKFLVSIVGLLATIITGYMSISQKIIDEAKVKENHEVRIHYLEEDRNELKSDIKETKSQTTQILILLQNKQDRK